MVKQPIKGKKYYHPRHGDVIIVGRKTGKWTAKQLGLNKDEYLARSVDGTNRFVVSARSLKTIK